MKGYSIGILEIVIYFIGSNTFRNYYPIIKKINKITYFWVMMTILTGIWELSFITNYMKVSKM
jgi:hypothetical protein